MRTNVHWGLEGHPEVANINTMLSLLLSISNCSMLLVLESKFLMSSKFHTEKFFAFKIFASWSLMRNMRNFAPYENFPLYGMQYLSCITSPQIL